jgi:pimeloyl-ACP methyl ester carboxylesterase
MFREHRTQVGPLRLNVMYGPENGPPLILFHGVLRRWETFLPILPALAARWQVVGLDFPGHGKSEWSGGECVVAEYVAAAAEFVRGQFASPVALYGHSLGAMVAAGVTATLGERVQSAVLEDPPFDTMGSRIRETRLWEYFHKLQAFAGDKRPIATIAAELAEIRTADPKSGAVQRLGDVRDAAALRFMAHCLQPLDPAVLKPIAAEKWLAGYDWRQCFRAITCPVLLLQADEGAGGMLTDEDAREAVSLARDATCLKFAGAGHNLHVMRTVEVLHAALAFLEPHRTF